MPRIIGISAIEQHVKSRDLWGRYHMILRSKVIWFDMQRSHDLYYRDYMICCAEIRMICGADITCRRSPVAQCEAQ